VTTDDLAPAIAAAADALRRGGLVAYPTETFYGLGALASDPAAVTRLAAAKGRPDGKPLPLLAADRAAVDEVAVLGPLALRLAERFWPGPVTLVVPARSGLPPEVTGGTGTVGIRIPGSEVARALARAAGGAIVSTSANVTGGPPPARAEDLAPALCARLDAILDGGPTPGGRPSTVIRVDGTQVKLIREGAVPFSEIQAAVPPGALHPEGR
jgi:L-threonylcarbamoyladenylate synthase